MRVKQLPGRCAIQQTPSFQPRGTRPRRKRSAPMTQPSAGRVSGHAAGPLRYAPRCSSCPCGLGISHGEPSSSSAGPLPSCSTSLRPLRTLWRPDGSAPPTEVGTRCTSDDCSPRSRGDRRRMRQCCCSTKAALDCTRSSSSLRGNGEARGRGACLNGGVCVILNGFRGVDEAQATCWRHG